LAGEVVERRTVHYKPSSSLWIDIVRKHVSLLNIIFTIVHVSRNDAPQKVGTIPTNNNVLNKMNVLVTQNNYVPT